MEPNKGVICDIIKPFKSTLCKFCRQSWGQFMNKCTRLRLVDSNSLTLLKKHISFNVCSLLNVLKLPCLSGNCNRSTHSHTLLNSRRTSWALWQEHRSCCSLLPRLDTSTLSLLPNSSPWSLQVTCSFVRSFVCYHEVRTNILLQFRSWHQLFCSVLWYPYPNESEQTWPRRSS